MTMPLVQLGPGGDYIRRIVPTNDRLQSVTRPFSLTDSSGRLVSRPNPAASTVGPIAWLLTALQAMGLIQLRTAASPIHTALPSSKLARSVSQPEPPGSSKRLPTICSLPFPRPTLRSSNASSVSIESRSAPKHSIDPSRLPRALFEP